MTPSFARPLLGLLFFATLTPFAARAEDLVAKEERKLFAHKVTRPQAEALRIQIFEKLRKEVQELETLREKIDQHRFGNVPLTAESARTLASQILANYGTVRGDVRGILAAQIESTQNRFKALENYREAAFRLSADPLSRQVEFLNRAFSDRDGLLETIQREADLLVNPLGQYAWILSPDFLNTVKSSAYDPWGGKGVAAELLCLLKLVRVGNCPDWRHSNETFLGTLEEGERYAAAIKTISEYGLILGFHGVTAESDEIKFRPRVVLSDLHICATVSGKNTECGLLSALSFVELGHTYDPETQTYVANPSPAVRQSSFEAIRNGKKFRGLEPGKKKIFENAWRQQENWLRLKRQ